MLGGGRKGMGWMEKDEGNTDGEKRGEEN